MTEVKQICPGGIVNWLEIAHTFLFWDSPKLKLYWEGVHTEILAILKIDLPLDPLFIGAIPDGAIGKRKACFIGGKKMPTLFWLKPLPPT